MTNDGWLFIGHPFFYQNSQREVLSHVGSTNKNVCAEMTRFLRNYFVASWDSMTFFRCCCCGWTVCTWIFTICHGNSADMPNINDIIDKSNCVRACVCVCRHQSFSICLRFHERDTVKTLDLLLLISANYIAIRGSSVENVHSEMIVCKCQTNQLLHIKIVLKIYLIRYFVCLCYSNPHKNA